MEYISSDKNYSYRFINHFEGFLNQYELFGKSTPLLVAVSGGIDSIAILFAINSLRKFGYSNSLRVLHINHGTRSGQLKEEEFVTQFCDSLDIECITKKFSDLNPHKNFEYTARVKRYDEMYKLALPDEKIILAHHIDDSFEWSMLQTLRSSGVEGLVGIPLINDRVVRPFMCVTKDQIIRYASCFDLPFIEDPTNEQTKYERNYIRLEVVPAFKARYKRYLKHYVYRHNEIARRLGMHLRDKNKSHFDISFGVSTVVIFSQQMGADLSGLTRLITQAMKRLNPNSRGTLAKQIENIKTALANGKHGPLTLTNGILAYLDFNTVLMIAKKETAVLKPAYDDYQSFTLSQYRNYLHAWLYSSTSNMDFPFITLCEHSFMKSNSSNFTFNEQIILDLKKSGVHFYPALRLLREWSKKRNNHKVLKLNFLRNSI